MDPSRIDLVNSVNFYSKMSENFVPEHFTEHESQQKATVDTKDIGEQSHDQGGEHESFKVHEQSPVSVCEHNAVPELENIAIHEDNCEHDWELENNIKNKQSEQSSKINYGYIPEHENDLTGEHDPGNQLTATLSKQTSAFDNNIANTDTNITFTDELKNELKNNSKPQKEFEKEFPSGTPKKLGDKLVKVNSEKLCEAQNQNKEETDSSEIKDSGYAWVVVGAMFVSNILTTGYVKGFGVVYNEILEQYPEATGTMAGIMMSLLSGFRSLFAPLAGMLANYIGVRKTMCLGAFIYSSALFASYFCSSLLHLSITLGAMVGLSHCIIESCQVVIISQYFETKLSKANGIRVAGSPCGGILYPLLLTILLQHFGLQTTFLFLALITLNIFICALLMKPFYLRRIVNKIKGILKKEESGNQDELSFKYRGFLKKNSSLGKNLNFIYQNEVKGISYRLNDATKSSQNYLDIEKCCHLSPYHQWVSSSINETENQISHLYNPSSTKFNDSIKNDLSGLSERGVDNLSAGIYNTPIKNDLSHTKSSETKNTKEKPKKKLDFSFLKNPQYLLFVFMAAWIPMGLPLVLYYTTIYAKNVAGLSAYEVTILLSYQAVLDFCLRIFIGWVNNKNLYKKSNGFVACLWLSALGSVFMTFGNNSLVHLIGAISLYTFGPASYHTFVNVILTETFGKKNIASTWGFVRMTQGAFSFLHPTIIGYLVDRTGAYTIPFMVMGGGMFLCGVIIFLGRFFKGGNPESSKEKGST